MSEPSLQPDENKQSATPILAAIATTLILIAVGLTINYVANTRNPAPPSEAPPIGLSIQVVDGNGVPLADYPVMFETASELGVRTVSKTTDSAGFALHNSPKTGELRIRAMGDTDEIEYLDLSTVSSSTLEDKIVVEEPVDVGSK